MITSIIIISIIVRAVDIVIYKYTYIHTAYICTMCKSICVYTYNHIKANMFPDI